MRLPGQGNGEVLDPLASQDPGKVPNGAAMQMHDSAAALPSPPVAQDKKYSIRSQGKNLVDMHFAPAEKVSVWNSMS